MAARCCCFLLAFVDAQFDSRLLKQPEPSRPRRHERWRCQASTCGDGFVGSSIERCEVRHRRAADWPFVLDQVAGFVLAWLVRLERDRHQQAVLKRRMTECQPAAFDLACVVAPCVLHRLGCVTKVATELCWVQETEHLVGALDALDSQLSDASRHGAASSPFGQMVRQRTRFGIP